MRTNYKQLSEYYVVIAIVIMCQRSLILTPYVIMVLLELRGKYHAVYNTRRGLIFVVLIFRRSNIGSPMLDDI